MLYDDREKKLFQTVSHGISTEYLNKGPIFVDDKYSAFFKGEPVFIEDLQNDPRIHYPEAAAQEGLVSLLSFPIKCRYITIGLFRLYHSEPIKLHEDDMDSISILAQQLGLVIENNGLKNFLDGVKIWSDENDWILMIPDQYSDNLCISVQAENREKGLNLINEYSQKIDHWIVA